MIATKNCKITPELDVFAKLKRLFTITIMIFLCLDSVNAQSQVKKYVQVQYIMGTLFKIELYTSDKSIADNTFSKAFQEIRKYDLIMSNYKPESEVSSVLKAATKKPVKISPELSNIVKISLDFSEITGGLFDISIAPLVELWGFKNKNFVKPSDSEISEIKKLVNYKNIILNPYDNTLFLTHPGMKLDFGAIGKGYAIEKAAEILKKDGITSGMIDSVSNQYYIGSSPGLKYWKVGIKDPRNERKIIKYVYIRDKSVSTSGDYEQFFIKNNVRYSHIINPKTGYPVKEAIASTIVTENATAADALSTSILLLDENMTKSVLKRFPGTYALKIIKSEKNFKTIEYQN
jgi:thiamine biosynthesis lipoprotein